jgi:PAS domain S-box-containing protein
VGQRLSIGRLGQGLALAAACFAVGELARMLSVPPGHARALDPASGIALVAVLLGGRGLAWGVWLGTFLTHFSTAAETAEPARAAVVAGMIGLGATAQALFGAALIRSAVGLPAPLLRDSEVLRFLVLGGPVACLVGAVCGVATLAASGIAPIEVVPFSAFTWWVGDAIGVWVSAPLLMIALAPPREVWRARWLSVGVPLAIALAATAALFAYAREWEGDRAYAEFERLSDEIAHGIQEELLRGAGAVDLDEVMAAPLRKADREGVGLRLEDATTGQHLWGEPIRLCSGYCFSSAHALDAGDRRWTLHATLDERSRTAQASPQAWIVMSGAVLLDALLATFLLILTGRTAQIESLVSERTRELSQTKDALEQELRDREQAERALRASENQFRSVSESANDAIVLADRDGRIVSWNPAATRQFGYEAREALGQSLCLIVPERYRGMAESGLARLRSGSALPRVLGASIQLAGLHKNGSEFPLEISLSSWSTSDGMLYSGILRDVTERQAAEAELQRAKEAAEAGDRAKSAFLANMSHEIRTPMNAVIGMTGLLLDTELEEQQREFVETIRMSGNHLLTVINEILDLSKIDAGHLELEMSRFDVRRCVDEAIDLIAPRANQKGLALRHRIRPDVPPIVFTDAGRLRQVLVNLIDNAIKFTERGSVDVEVTARALAAHEVGQPNCELCFSVRDTGHGIPADQVERLFEPFTQADASITRRFGGTGLGLTISKRLCERLGGRLWVESEVGRGSTFAFTIAADVGVPAEWAQSSAPRAPARGAAAGAAMRRQRILLAEDNAVNQKVAKLMLRKLGFRDVDAVGNGIEAIAALERQTYDVVLMDVQMPEMDGLEAARWIRARWPRPPRLIAMTAHALAGDRERCLAAGMDGYLAKPIQASELAAELAREPDSEPEPQGTRAPVPVRLAALLAQVSDLSVVSEVVDDFEREARGASAGIRAAFAGGDATTARRIAHTLGSTALLVGAADLCALAREIERLADAGDVAGALARVTGLDPEVGDAVRAASAERDALRGEPPP